MMDEGSELNNDDLDDMLSSWKTLDCRSAPNTVGSCSAPVEATLLIEPLYKS
jgi:hypothetical protein